jgi:hypothetical protein
MKIIPRYRRDQELLDNPRNELDERIERKFIAFVTLLAEW